MMISLVAEKNRNFLTILRNCVFGGQKSEIKVSVGLFPSGGSEGESVPDLSLRF